MAKRYRVHVHDHADQGRWLAQADFARRPDQEAIKAALPVLGEPGRYEVRICLAWPDGSEVLVSGWLQGDPAPAADGHEHCATCGCKLGRTVSTPIDSSLAFTALLELHPTYGRMSDPEASQLRQRFLADWLASGHTDMWAYCKHWIAENPPAGQSSGRADKRHAVTGPDECWNAFCTAGDCSTTARLTARPSSATCSSPACAGTASPAGPATGSPSAISSTTSRPPGRRDMTTCPACGCNGTDLSKIMEFDHPVRVDADGTVHDDLPGVYAPELLMGTDGDGSVLAEHEADYIAEAERQGWQLLAGWTGQYGYRGVVMHASENVGALADHIRETPGTYVVISVETDDDDDEDAAGWAIAYRPAG